MISPWIASVLSTVSQVIVLCEDAEHQDLIRGYLRERKVVRGRIVLRPLASGAGSAEAMVRIEYPKLVQHIRGRHAKSLLIVVVDADTQPIENRREQLEEELVKQEMPRIEADDAVCVLVPKRHVETWLVCLNGDAANEQDRYDRRAFPGDKVRAAAKELARTALSGKVPAKFVASLRTGVAELRARGAV